MDNNDDRLLLELPAEAENLALIRRAVGGQAETYGLRGSGVDDLRTVISEACANVVLHAYPADATERPLEVELMRQGSELEAVVRDRGKGIQPSIGPKPASLQLGLLMIGAIANRFELRSARDRGTELSMTFPLLVA